MVGSLSTQKQIGLVDYGSGNLRSVSKALEASGAQVSLVVSPEQTHAVDALVVPGVGSFGDCAKNLAASGLWDPIREWLLAGKPYLGICLGYQLLFDESEETPGQKGLGIFPGKVVRFQSATLKVPHMGWNTLSATRGPLFEGLPADERFYFVHSYYPEPSDPSLPSAMADYGQGFAAAISKGAIHATQFHPEKSQSAGLAVLRNFLRTLA
jgi:imidazole glycerol-phosphate synthase subunit HisH